MGYNKMEPMEGYPQVKVSKHEKVNNQVGEMMWQVFKRSKLTKAQLAHTLGWTEHRLMQVFSGDKTITTFEMVHIAGALGYRFDLSLARL